MRARLVGWFLLALGLISLAGAIIYESFIPALVGLGLTFWGPLLLYISTEKYVKQALLDSTVVPSLADLDQMLTELEYQGKRIYLPPKYFKDFETSRIFIPKNKGTDLPTPQEIQQQEEKIFLENPAAVLIIPPGQSLSKLFEKTLGTSFTKLDLKYLQENLPKLFIEDLEIAEALELEIEHGEVVHSKITNSVYKDIHRQAMKLSRICNAIGCPICSAIACALAKATGKAVTIERTEASEEGKILEAYYRILQD